MSISWFISIYVCDVVDDDDDGDDDVDDDDVGGADDDVGDDDDEEPIYLYSLYFSLQSSTVGWGFSNLLFLE